MIDVHDRVDLDFLEMFLNPPFVAGSGAAVRTAPASWR